MGWIADLLEQIPSAAAYKVQLEKLDSDYKILQTKCEHLESENRHLRSQLEAAKREIKKLQQRDEKELWHGSNRSEVETKVLIALGVSGWTDDRGVAQLVSIGEQAANFHLTELDRAHLVTWSTGQYDQTIWNLSHEGRRYLMQRGLLK